tara:strand:- start:324 stop:578 length:255 start_codon:yes stop_codon:yes gene_type:complete
MSPVKRNIWTIYQQGKGSTIYDNGGTDHQQVLSDYLTIRILRGGRLAAHSIAGLQFSIENETCIKQFVLRSDFDNQSFSLHEVD